MPPRTSSSLPDGSGPPVRPGGPGAAPGPAPSPVPPPGAMVAQPYTHHGAYKAAHYPPQPYAYPPRNHHPYPYGYQPRPPPHGHPPQHYPPLKVLTTSLQILCFKGRLTSVTLIVLTLPYQITGSLVRASQPTALEQNQYI